MKARASLGHRASRRPQSPHHESNVATRFRRPGGRSTAEELAPPAGADPATSGVTGRRSSVELQRRAVDSGGALPPTRTEITGVRARSVAVTTAGRTSVELELNQHSLDGGWVTATWVHQYPVSTMQRRD